MFDAKGRSIHYLRLSVTDLCNLRCRYCMPDGAEKLEREDILTYEEFLRLAALFAKCGVDTVRVTGGEPLVRKGVDYLVAQLKAIPGILMPAIILGGIFSGYFTPSEAAAVAVVYALLVSTFVYRDMSLKKLYTTMLGSAKTSAVIMIIIACSGPFGWALANWKIPEAISSAVLSVSTNKYVILFLISLIILVAGVFMETSSAIIILTPVFLPLVRALGISTLHFGILFVVGIAIGMITPPVAINLFVASGITGLSLEKISKAVVPYLIGLIVVFLAIVYLPLFIPGFIG